MYTLTFLFIHCLWIKIPTLYFIVRRLLFSNFSWVLYMLTNQYARGPFIKNQTFCFACQGFLPKNVTPPSTLFFERPPAPPAYPTQTSPAVAVCSMWNSLSKNITVLKTDASLIPKLLKHHNCNRLSALDRRPPSASNLFNVKQPYIYKKEPFRFSLNKLYTLLYTITLFSLSKPSEIKANSEWRAKNQGLEQQHEYTASPP